jgi:hypothetical protein
MEQEPLVEYEPPEVVDHGDLVELTAGQGSGHPLDFTFHAGADPHHPSFSDA